MIQLEFFKDPPTETEILRKELEAVRASADKVRKGIFARHNELCKMYIELKDDLDIIKRNICKGDKNGQTKFISTDDNV